MSARKTLPNSAECMSVKCFNSTTFSVVLDNKLPQEIY